LKGIDGVLVENDASISTGSAGSAVFVIGRDAFIIWGNSRLELNPTLDRKQNEISEFSLRSGALLSVFVGKKHTLSTVTVVIVINGTGVYLDAHSEKNLRVCLLRDFQFVG